MKRTGLFAVGAVLVAGAAFAQPRAGGPPRQGGARPGGMRMPFMRMMDRPLTLSQVPGATLKAVFKLSADQEKQIEGIQQRAMETIRSSMPQMQPGQRPDRAAFEKARPKIEAAMKKADGEILRVLTPAQQKQVPAMLKEMHALRGSGLPMSLAGSLKLSSDQLSKLEKIAKERVDATAKLFQGNQGDRMAAMQKMGQLREDARKKAMAVLNAQQKAAVEKWEKEHPRRGFMGGPGGPGMGGPALGGPRRPGMPGPGGGRPSGPGGGIRR